MTIPHKEAAFGLARRGERGCPGGGRGQPALAGRWPGDHGRQYGYAFGFIESLDRGFPGLERRRRVIAWSSVPVALRARLSIGLSAVEGPSPVVLANRTRQRRRGSMAHGSLDADGRRMSQVIDWRQDRQSVVADVRAHRQYDVTRDGPITRHWKSNCRLPARPDCVVADIVYSPLETPLLSSGARHCGLACSSTVYGCCSIKRYRRFEAWFGVRPEPSRAELRQMVEADLIAEQD